MSGKLPDVFRLIARNKKDPATEEFEIFYAWVYEHDSDRWSEASLWAERYIEQGYIVEYKEEVQ